MPKKLVNIDFPIFCRLQRQMRRCRYVNYDFLLNLRLSKMASQLFLQNVLSHMSTSIKSHKEMASMHHSISCYALIIHHLHGKIKLRKDLQLERNWIFQRVSPWYLQIKLIWTSKYSCIVYIFQMLKAWLTKSLKSCCLWLIILSPFWHCAQNALC